MLWTPEVRDAKSVEDFLRRVQSVVLSPCSLINPWYVPLPPWEQIDYDKNHAGERMPEADQLRAEVKRWLDLRATLVPYLREAFAKYAADGTPPFRALVLDNPEDPECATVDDQWLIGDELLFAPMFAGEAERRVYLPEGKWGDYFGETTYTGGQWHTLECPLERLLLFKRIGST
jgi:alpha-D-xyloside xylohydrolase